MAPPPRDHRFDDVIDIKLPRVGGLRPRRLLWLALVAVLLVWASTSVYSVRTDEVAVVLRFGRFQRQEPPGLHLKAPAGIESFARVPVLNVLKEEFGFRTIKAGVDSKYEEKPEEALMLTGDLNLVYVEWIVQYGIKDARAYLFHVRNVTVNIRAATEAVTRKVVGDRSFDEVITQGELLPPLIQKELQALLDEYHMGIEVQLVKMQHIGPPADVKDAFNDVNNALQERDTLVNKARESYNQTIPTERGKAQASITTAEGYALDRVNRAKGEAERFQALLAEYRKAPEVTEQRLYLEAMAELLPQLQKKYIVEGAGKTVLPLLPWGDGARAPVVQP